MKGAPGNATKLQAILKRHAAAAPPPPRFGAVEPGDPVALLLHAMLLWESTTEAADRAMARLAERLIDWNELRVCLVDDTEEIIGTRYPLARERCAAIRQALNAIYKKHHRVDLSHLAAGGKREARAYLESLPGVPPAVAARVLLAGFGGAAMPVDERLRRRLVAAGVAAEEATASDLAAWIAKTVGADRLPETMHALQAFSDATAEPAAKPAAKTAAKPTAKPAAKPADKSAAKAGKGEGKTAAVKSEGRPAGRAATAPGKNGVKSGGKSEGKSAAKAAPRTPAKAAKASAPSKKGRVAKAGSRAGGGR